MSTIMLNIPNINDIVLYVPLLIVLVVSSVSYTLRKRLQRERASVYNRQS